MPIYLIRLAEMECSVAQRPVRVGEGSLAWFSFATMSCLSAALSIFVWGCSGEDASLTGGDAQQCVDGTFAHCLLPLSAEASAEVRPTSDAAGDATGDMQGLCSGPPRAGCAAALGGTTCGIGFTCDTNPAHGCAPSECSCNPPQGWSCSADCNGGVCIAVRLDASAEVGLTSDASGAGDADGDTQSLCSGPPRAGCAAAFGGTVCKIGFTCDTNPAHGCAPSECSCNPPQGWSCSADCNGGVCVPVQDAGRE